MRLFVTLALAWPSALFAADRIAFLDAHRLARATKDSKPPVYGHQSRTAVRAVMEGLVSEIIEGLRTRPDERRGDDITLIAAVTLKQWTIDPPAVDAPTPLGLAFLIERAAHTAPVERAMAEGGLRAIVDRIYDDALVPRASETASPVVAERAVAWLARLDHPLTTTALNSVAHRAPEVGVRLAATRALFTRAGARLNDQFQAQLADFCARALLDDAGINR